LSLGQWGFLLAVFWVRNLPKTQLIHLGFRGTKDKFSGHSIYEKNDEKDGNNESKKRYELDTVISVNGALTTARYAINATLQASIDPVGFIAIID
jgi:hypothetical protein